MRVGFRPSFANFATSRFIFRTPASGSQPNPSATPRTISIRRSPPVTNYTRRASYPRNRGNPILANTPGTPPLEPSKNKRRCTPQFLQFKDSSLPLCCRATLDPFYIYEEIASHDKLYPTRPHPMYTPLSRQKQNRGGVYHFGLRIEKGPSRREWNPMECGPLGLLSRSKLACGHTRILPPVQETGVAPEPHRDNHQS